MSCKFTLYGQPITKKNSIRVFRGVVLPSKAYTDYEKDCHLQLSRLELPRFTCQVAVTCKYYMKNSRKVDLNNLMAATADIISDKIKRKNGTNVVVKELILADDEQIKSWDGTRKYVDRSNPRVEIEIKKFTE